MAEVVSSIQKVSLSNGFSSQVIGERLELFEQLKAKYQEQIRAIERKKIKCSLASGSFDGVSYETTPGALLSQVKKNNRIIAARVNGQLWDLSRPLEEDSSVEFVSFDDPEGKEIFWHSSAHVLGEAMETLYDARLSSGPPVERGFYYDVFMGTGVVSSSDLPKIEAECSKFVGEKQPFERVVVAVEDLYKLFKHNEFKLRVLKEKVVGDFTTVYRCGSLVDLCRGPHVQDTGVLAAFSVTKNSSAYWGGTTAGESLQRVYGVSFPSAKELKEHFSLIEEAEKRDHRKIGRDHELFFFHELSPGSCFFLPKGAHIYNKLCDFIRTQYRVRGYTEVVSPNIYNVDLWKTSGHWENYRENMFMIDIDNEKFGLKPMNCPGHCLMYQLRPRSWKELPMRFADFGVLHRNELAGALSGLTRVRRFCQDDAHIFCRLDDISSEVRDVLQFIFFVHRTFGLTFKLSLSTRPEKSLGDDAVWEKAEASLRKCLDESGFKWELNPGDGAFYGPKIDVQVEDALRRLHQLSTVQLDFNLPKRFQLKYISPSGNLEEPVMIHRAIFGSIERVIGILTEHYGGKWPFWLSPNHVVIISCGPECDDYALGVSEKVRKAGYFCDVDCDTTVSFNKKIRNATLSYCNYIFVLGKKEMESQTISVRNRSMKQYNEKKIEDILAKFNRLAESYSLCDELDF